MRGIFWWWFKWAIALVVIPLCAAAACFALLAYGFNRPGSNPLETFLLLVALAVVILTFAAEVGLIAIGIAKIRSKSHPAKRTQSVALS